MRKANIFQRLGAFVIDAYAIVFLFQIVAFLISPFYFLPLSPGLWILWIMYYIVSYNTFSNTLGESFFNTKVVADKGRVHTGISLNYS